MILLTGAGPVCRHLIAELVRAVFVFPPGSRPGRRPDRRPFRRRAGPR